MSHASYIKYWEYTEGYRLSWKEGAKVYEVMFFYIIKIYVYSESVFNTLYIELKHKSVQKIPSFFSREL